MSFFDISSERAIIAGGTQGIGRAIAERFVRAGATVAVAGQTPESGEAAAAEMSAALSADVLGDGAEVTDADSVANCFGRLEEALGGVDILVVTAGIVGPSEPIWELSPETFRRIVEINLLGTAHWCRVALPGMRARRHGAVVTFASVAGKEGNPLQSAYCAAKAGVMTLTKSLAKEVVTDGVRVNCVAPGITATEMSRNTPAETVAYILRKVPMGRMGEPDEIAAIAHLLASPDAGFTTGQVYDASGGRATY
jgi:3-oxoacyl-[acyl-carrier protein] reductase